MRLIDSRHVFTLALKDKFAIPAFNAHNMEMLQAAVMAAAEVESPVIIQISEKTISYAGLETMAAICQAAAKQYGVPVVLHLDHSKNLNTIESCLRAGYTSIMADGSELSYEANVDFVRRAVSLARLYGASVEAELGRIGGVEDDYVNDDTYLTAPELALEFVHETGIQCLAPSVGNQHGMYVNEVSLDFDRITAISQITQIPLALHGGSGILPEDLTRAIRCGIAKLNIGTELKIIFANALRSQLTDITNVQPWDYIHCARTELVHYMRQKFIDIGAVGILSKL
ncbi:class II fructose-bisphosphate aldolase [Alicyclobacillus dauci]|uniref:Class II fructose-bisphosphate aldolase n=1 Tax=Alicyclobacillus dauci TaxID=1475485 RepID=A0ABY6YXE9_9BACL|nr:class II fructose-bisphosphate aldolase [Alicyclobacillus dauci]WAH35191.1 class II fructose-bisphosphate aldolase [Alicyclobacillus dauci]